MVFFYSWKASPLCRHLSLSSVKACYCDLQVEESKELIAFANAAY